MALHLNRCAERLTTLRSGKTTGVELSDEERSEDEGSASYTVREAAAAADEAKDIDLDDLDSSDEAQQVMLDSRQRKTLLKRRKAKKEKEDKADVARLEATGVIDCTVDAPRLCTPVDYERQLLSARGEYDPDEEEAAEATVLLWIQYIAYWLQLSEIPKARAVAERAVAAMAFWPERHRFNIWTVYLNMESSFGNDATLEKVHERANVQCGGSAVKLGLHLASMYEQTEKTQLLLSLLAKLTREHQQSVEVWVYRCAYHFRRYTQLSGRVGSKGESEESLGSARNVVAEGVGVLPRKKQDQFLSSCAKLEMFNGSEERSVAMFENLVGTKPKRLDLWNLYFDSLIKMLASKSKNNKSSVDKIRRTFERASSTDLPPFKMKSIFTRWLAFEREYGDGDGEESVKQAAQDFVNAREESSKVSAD
eukprot:Lankesteria_metandrocarpae@DN2405_c0_g1_i1.p1